MTAFRILLIGAAFIAAASPLAAQRIDRIGALTTHENEIMVPLVGFGIVYGLEGTGDRNLGGFGTGASPSAQAIANLLRRFDMAVPPELLRPRNVAAVIVEAQVSPYLKPGGRFDLHVSSIQDATSLRGGRLLMMPFVTNPGEPPIGIGSGGILVTDDPASRLVGRGGTSGRIPSGGLLEAALPGTEWSATPGLNLNRPDVITAMRIAESINASLGEGVAVVEDPGTVRLNPPAEYADNLNGLFAGIDTLTVTAETQPRIIINRHDGSIATVGAVTLGAATVSHNGITVSIGGTQGEGPSPQGVVTAPIGVSVHDIAAGLHAAGARPRELAAIFDLLRQAGALAADVEIQ